MNMSYGLHAKNGGCSLHRRSIWSSYGSQACFKLIRASRIQPVKRRIATAAAKTPDAEAQQQRQQSETSLTASVTTIGLGGTIAVAGATLAGINLFGLFHWSSSSDLAFALQLYLPLLAAEAALFGIKHQIPPALLDDEGQQQQQHVQQMQHSEQGQQEGQQQQQQQLQLLDMAAVTSECNSTSSLASWQLLLALYPVLLQRCQSDLQLFSLPQVVGLILGRDTSRVLLQQGFMLTALAGWLTDRLYEAGLDDVVLLPGLFSGAADSSQGLELPQLGLWLASLTVTAFWVPAAFIAAEEAREAFSGAMLLRTDAGQALAAQAAAARGSGGGGRGGGSRANAAASNLAGEQQQLRQAGEGERQDDEDEDEEEQMDPLVLEYRVAKVTKQCFGSAPAVLAYNVTLLKELARIMLPNVACVATGGNLAAVLTGSLAASGLLVLHAALAERQLLPLMVKVVSTSSSSGSSGGSSRADD